MRGRVEGQHAVIWKAIYLWMTEPSDAMYDREVKWSRTEPPPVVRGCLDGYITSPRYLKWPICEVRFKPQECGSCDALSQGLTGRSGGWPYKKTADRSSKINNKDLEAALASLRSSTTESKAVSVECPLLKPDCFLSRRLFCVRKADNWFKPTISSVFAIKVRRETGL